MTQIELLLKINKKLLNLADDKIKPEIIKILEKQGNSNLDYIFHMTITGLFAKSTKTFRALFILCHQCYGEDAAILARSLLENVINLAYIRKSDSKHRAKLFALYSLVANDNFIKENPEISVRISREFYKKWEKGFKIAQTFHKKECRRIKNKYSKSNDRSWSGMSVKKMCTIVGKRFNKLYYNKIYWKLCQFSHSDNNALCSYIFEQNDNIIINDMPSKSWVEESLILGFDCYYRVINLINEIFKLDFKNDLEKIEKEYVKIFGK